MRGGGRIARRLERIDGALPVRAGAGDFRVGVGPAPATVDGSMTLPY